MRLTYLTAPKNTHLTYIIAADSLVYSPQDAFLATDFSVQGDVWTLNIGQARTFPSKEAAFQRAESVQGGKTRVLFVSSDGKVYEVEHASYSPSEDKIREELEKILKRNREADQTVYVNHSNFNHSNVAEHDIVWLAHILQGLLDGKTPQQLLDGEK